MKPQNLLKKLAGLVVCGTVATAAFQAGAISLTFGDSHTLGYISKDTPANPASEVTYINSILGLSLGGSGSSGKFTRTANVFSPLDTVSSVTVAPISGTGTTFSLGTTGYEYLVAKYGPDAIVWYVGGLTGNITIPGTIADTDVFHFGGLSGYNGFTPYPSNAPAPNPGSVPDGGGTLMLLGLAGLGLFVFVRKFQTV